MTSTGFSYYDSGVTKTGNGPWQFAYAQLPRLGNVGINPLDGVAPQCRRGACANQTTRINDLCSYSAQVMAIEALVMWY